MDIKDKARKIAQAIVDEDTEAVLAAKRDASMSTMSRREIIKLKELVHSFVETLKPTVES